MTVRLGQTVLYAPPRLQAPPSYVPARIRATALTGGLSALSGTARRELDKMKLGRKLAQTPPAGATPLMPIRPSIVAAGGLAGFALGSHFVPKKYPVLKHAMVLGAVLSGLAGGYFLYAGE